MLKILRIIWRRGHCTWKRSSHHFVPLSSSGNGHKLTSQDESYVDIHEFNVPSLLEIGDISPSAYVTCMYNSIWWVGTNNLVDIATEDIITTDFIHPHGPRKTINVVIHVMFLWKTLFKRYQLLLHLLGEPTR